MLLDSLSDADVVNILLGVMRSGERAISLSNNKLDLSRLQIDVAVLSISN